VLICGEDEFSVKRRARRLYDEWCAAVGGMDHEMIDASAGNSGEALAALSRLREALQTLPFFGQSKVVWLRDCNFLGDDRVSRAQAVSESLSALAVELKNFDWRDVRLLVSAGKVDRRKAFFKTVSRVGTVEDLVGLSFEDRDWAVQAEAFARHELEARGKEIEDLALGELVAAVGPNLRELSNEIEKLALFAGERRAITAEDVASLVTPHKHAQAFALGDALGDRDLPRTLRALDEELWSIRTKVDRNKTVIGLLYGLIAKVRILLLLKEMLGVGLIQPTDNYPRFKAQLSRVPSTGLPRDKRYNPLGINAYVLFKALPQAQHFSTAELVAAMERFLECNRRLVSSGLDETLVLQQTIVEVVGARPVASVGSDR
jgi:DNA polymerase-3 subunit delta